MAGPRSPSWSPACADSWTSIASRSTAAAGSDNSRTRSATRSSAAPGARMAAIGCGTGGLREIARRIGRKLGRSTETIRLPLKAYDRDHPDRPVFANSTAPLDEKAKGQIYKHYRRGVSVEVLARQF